MATETKPKTGKPKPTDIATVDAEHYAAILNQVVVRGDLSRLTEADRFVYYTKVCESLSLNPLTKPFEYITLQNRLTLYATRSCTDQIGARDGIDVAVTHREEWKDLFVVSARASKDGRSVEVEAAVPLTNGKTGQPLKGEDLANARMKADTKARRRAVLSFCGLGMLDETEFASIPAAFSVVGEEPQAQPQANVVVDEFWEQRKYILAIGEANGFTLDILNQGLKRKYNKTLDLLTGDELAATIEAMSTMPKQPVGVQAPPKPPPPAPPSPEPRPAAAGEQQAPEGVERIDPRTGEIIDGEQLREQTVKDEGVHDDPPPSKDDLFGPTPRQGGEPADGLPFDEPSMGGDQTTDALVCPAHGEEWKRSARGEWKHITEDMKVCTPAVVVRLAAKECKVTAKQLDDYVAATYGGMTAEELEPDDACAVVDWLYSLPGG